MPDKLHIQKDILHTYGYKQQQSDIGHHLTTKNKRNQRKMLKKNGIFKFPNVFVYVFFKESN